MYLQYIWILQSQFSYIECCVAQALGSDKGNRMGYTIIMSESNIIISQYDRYHMYIRLHNIIIANEVVDRFTYKFDKHHNKNGRIAHAICVCLVGTKYR